MCSSELYLCFGKRDVEGKRVHIAPASYDGDVSFLGPARTCDPSMIFAQGVGEDVR